MKKNILHVHAVNLRYSQGLVKDVADNQMCLQPGGVTNHAAWVLGHLAVACDVWSPVLGTQPTCPKGWDALFGRSSKPTSDRAAYPSKDDLLKHREAAHASIAKGFEKLSEADLEKPFPWERMRPFFPTVGDGVIFFMTTHEATHLGQLSAWRRAMGFPSVL